MAHSTALALVLALVAGPADTTTPMAALQERLLAQQALRRFNLEIQVRTFAKAGDRQPIHEFTASIQRDRDRMLRSFQQFLILTSKRCTLTVDRSRSLILYSRKEAATRAVQLPPGFDTQGALETLLRPTAAPGVTQVDEATWIIEEPGRFPGTQVRIAFHPADGRLQEIAYLPKESAASSSGPIIIRYLWKDAAVLDRSHLSEDHFVTRTHGRLVPSAAFEGYELRVVDIDQDHATR